MMSPADRIKNLTNFNERLQVEQEVGPLKDWVVVGQDRNKRDIQNFVSICSKKALSMGFSIENPKYYYLQNDNVATYEQTLEKVKSKMNPQLIVCIVTNEKKDRYAAIKKKCCVDRPVPTQVVVYKNITAEKVMSTATKIAGGIPKILIQNNPVSIPLEDLMVVGFNVSYEGFGAMVASLDQNCGRYFSVVSCHTSGEELFSDFSVNLCKALKQFKGYNNKYPKNIVIYQDGVCEGKIPYLQEQKILLHLKTIYGDEEVNMCFIFVTKKINTRFFPPNFEKGTVVDGNVSVTDLKYDFITVSQLRRASTVTPTRYIIFYNESVFDVVKLQRLTSNLCHLYSDGSATSHLPAPCHYANKLALLVSQYIHQQPLPALQNLLYFI